MSLIFMSIWVLCLAAIWFWPTPNTENYRIRVRRGKQEYSRLNWTAYRRASMQHTCAVMFFSFASVAAALAATMSDAELRRFFSGANTVVVEQPSQQ